MRGVTWLRFSIVLVIAVLIVAAVVLVGPVVGQDNASGGDWRKVTACDQRKTVVVEGYSPNGPLPPEKARQVAALLGQLMAYCNEEVRARVTHDQRIFLSVNGSAFVQLVPGGPLPMLPVQGKLPTAREQQIWKAELTREVAQGNKLFHDSKLGTNGIACDMCHPDASNTHPETYPKFQTQLKKVVLLRDMINWCIENPLEGKPLAENSPEMKALESYILWQRNGKMMEAGKH